MQYTESEKKTFTITSNFEFVVEADTEQEALDHVIEKIADPLNCYLEIHNENGEENER